MTEFTDPNIASQLRPLLRAGLSMASVLLGAGLLMAVFGASDRTLIVAGLVVLVALPVVNVVVAFVDEIRLRQWRFAVAAGIVIVIVALNVLFK